MIGMVFDNDDGFAATVDNLDGMRLTVEWTTDKAVRHFQRFVVRGDHVRGAKAPLRSALG